MSDKPIRAWQLTMIFNKPLGYRETSSRKRREAMRTVVADFVATDAVDAAPKVLAILKRTARRIRNRRGVYVVDIAAPRVFDRAEGKNFLVGDEMLRLRDEFVYLTKLLHIRDPLYAFNVGYAETCRPLRELAETKTA